MRVFGSMAEPDPLDRFFRKLERHDRITSDERAALAACAGPTIEFAGGSDLVREGERPDRSLLLTAGFATRYRLLGDGQRQITAIHVPGDFVDLHSYVLHEMDHGVGALSQCEVVTFPHARLDDLTDRRPHLTRVLWRLTLLDSAAHREWLVAMGRRSAAQQMAHLICELYRRLDAVGLAFDHQFVFPITQAELGDTLGRSAVHVNRVMQELRTEGLFTWQGQTIQILDWKRLQQRAEFDPRYLHLHDGPPRPAPSVRPPLQPEPPAAASAASRTPEGQTGQ